MGEPIFRLLTQMAHHGAERFYAKKLAPNDNSKNQVYLGGGFGALNIIPHSEVEADTSGLAGAVRDRAKARVSFWWMDDRGITPAPEAQLILYPKYPEVRMSGFLQKAPRPPSDLMRSRDEGRVLFLGICPDGRVIGCVAAAGSPEAQDLSACPDLPVSGVFIDLQSIRQGGQDASAVLQETLRRIHLKGWIPSQKMGAGGVPEPYAAMNGGGYTLEAELGISPNGYAEPDFMGWEVKQYGVQDFVTYAPKSPVTLMTPEPSGGIYRDEGVDVFLHRYGYPDKSGKKGRINFGGIYASGRPYHADTRLKLEISGFSAETGKLTDLDGCIALVDPEGIVAASWGFRGLISHWNRKHAQAVYVPSLSRKPPPEYAYGGVIYMCEGADVLLLLQAFASGAVYYDPAVKMEGIDTGKPLIKRRSQFRVRHDGLSGLYRRAERVNLV